jgi:hypothetical protein
MLISLPVKYNEKSSNIIFQVVQSTNTFVVSPYNNTCNLYSVITYSYNYGINTLPIYFPLTFTISNNMLLCDLFFVINILSNHNDFFNILLSNINSFYNKKFIYFNTINKDAIINCIKLVHPIDDTEYTSVDNLMRRLYYRTNRYLNYSLALMYCDEMLTSNPCNKVQQIINIIKSLKINFYGNEMTVGEHIEHILNYSKDIITIKKKKKYFISNENTMSKLLDITSIDTSKYKVSVYPDKFSQYITINKLIGSLTIYNYTKMIQLVANSIYKKNPIYIKLIESNYISSDNLIELRELSNSIKIFEPQFLEYKLVEISISNSISNPISNPIPNSVSFEKFKELIEGTAFDVEVIKKLFDDYTHPLNYNKKTLNPTFAKILYYSFKYYKDIIDSDVSTLRNYINCKIKSVYIFILKIYRSIDQSIENDDSSYMFNARIYTDSIINIIIKILLFNDTFNLFSKVATKLPKFHKVFIENTIIVQILSNIRWKNISKQINMLNYLIDMKQTNHHLFIVDGKINKFITTNLDNRIRRIILDPIAMFQYLKKESDYYKWIVTFKDYMRKIFYNPIIFKDEDYIKLSKIIHLLSKINIQSIDCIEYNRLIVYLNKNINIIMFNDRINIKLKDVCRNVNINLGFLAKHINEYTEQASISITDEDNSIQRELDKLTKKYYKYKGRYLEIKSTTMRNRS